MAKAGAFDITIRRKMGDAVKAAATLENLIYRGRHSAGFMVTEQFAAYLGRTIPSAQADLEAAGVILWNGKS